MNIMLDLETLGLTQDAVILSIGAVLFDKDTIIGRFYCVVDKGAQPERIKDQQALDWWEKQSDTAKAVLNPNPNMVLSPSQAIAYWNNFLSPCRKTTAFRRWISGSLR